MREYCNSLKMRIDPKCKKFIKDIGLKVKALLIKKGWTLEETEEYGWDSWRQLQKIESGRNMTMATLWKVAKFYGTSPAEILKD